MASNIQLAVIVVCYHSDSVIQSCIDAVDNAVLTIPPDERPQVDLVLVANSEQDRDMEVRSGACRVIGLDAKENVGFAPAVNIGLQAAKHADFFLLLNPDTRLASDCLGALLSMAKSQGAALVGPILTDPTGKPHGLSERPFHSIRREFAMQVLAARRIQRPYGRRAGAMGDARCLTGACLLADGAFLREVGGLDTEVHMYLEDVMLCWEAHRRGRRVALALDARCSHTLGGSASGDNFSSSLGLYLTLLGARVSFMRRTSGASQALMMRVLIGVGAAIRVLLARGQRRKNLATLRWAFMSGRPPLWQNGPVVNSR